MRVIAALFGPYAPEALTAHVAVFSRDFKRFEPLTKLATSSVGIMGKEHQCPGSRIRGVFVWIMCCLLPLGRNGLKKEDGVGQGTSYGRALSYVLSAQPSAPVLLIITSGASPTSRWGASVVHARHGRRRHDGGVSRAAHSPRSRRSPYRRAVHTPPVVAPRPV